MTIPSCYFLPELPQGLEGLAELALDLRWSWNHTADSLWEMVNPEVWRITSNPWLILQTVSENHLKALAEDSTFMELMHRLIAEHREAIGDDAWFPKSYSASALKVAYFSMEFGLSEALPIYSGGLGILAGDYLKTASDLGVPVVGIGLLYQQGYFRQALTSLGNQIEFFPYNDPSQLPVVPARDQNEEWLQVSVNLPGRKLILRAWEAQVGRVKLYLLDSNDPVNSPADRGITSELYGGGSELRLQQEIALGIGGWKLLHNLNISANICHLNEGHAAFAVIERASAFMKSQGREFEESLAATRAGNIFTTHTPVEAGFDRFEPVMIDQYLGDYANQLGIGIEGLLALGRADRQNRREPFNMAYLAFNGSGAVNAVSNLHSEVSRRIFQPLFPRWPRAEVPVTFVTNGVHVPSWDSAEADEFWTEACGKGRWNGTLETIIDDLNKISDEVLWNLRKNERQKLIKYVRERFARQRSLQGATPFEIDSSASLLDPNALTIGFARRFTAYKRPNLLLHDPERLVRILNRPEQPVQMIIAGKAHPRDEEGKSMVREWWRFISRPDVRQHVVFLVDYDMALAENMVQGIDLWINTPRRPWEACGTSGMKVLVNGGLNLSEKDGWWAEAYTPEVGWALGDGQEHNGDPDWDAREADELYRLLEDEVIPRFYDRVASGIPHEWVARLRASISRLTPQFSTNRMLREYVEKLYLGAVSKYQDRTADAGQKGLLLCRQQELIKAHWPKLYFGKLLVQKENDNYIMQVPVYLDEIDPDTVQVQIFAEPINGGQPEIHVMEKTESLTGAVNGYLYYLQFPAKRPVNHYTPRIIPSFSGITVPLELNRILWYDVARRKS